MPTLDEALAQAKACHRDGRPQVAEQICREILAVQPNHVDALFFLAGLAYAAGNYPVAADCLRRAIGLNPRVAEFHRNLGLVCQALQRPDEAAACFRQALELQPNSVESYDDRQLALQDQRTADQSLAGPALEPDTADAHFYKGSDLAQQGRLAEAVVHYRRSLELRPDNAGVHNNLGNVLQEQGKLDEALACFRRAAQLQPGNAGIQNNLGNLLRQQGHSDEALACYRRGLELQPDNPGFYNNLGVVYKDQAKLDEAAACYRRAVELQPDFAVAYSNLLYCIGFHAGYEAQAICAEHRRWDRQFAAPLAACIRPHTNDRSPDRRLRVGYVSPDFRSHVESFYTVPLFSAHDHRNFEIFCYADVPSPDGTTARLQGYADVWRNVVGRTDEQIAQMVRADRIDILVDLTMHMEKNHILVFARKPAPVQVCWLAYPGTTGLSTMDYRLTDPHLDPPGLHADHYTEESIRLPDTTACYDPLTSLPAVAALPAEEKGYVTFGCLNNFCKVNDAVLRLWARVMQAVDGSRLMTVAVRGPHRQRTLDLLAQEGIRPERVTFVPYQSRLKYLETYHGIDIGLDSFPYNGHTTSMDSFWMGVPVVTIAGQRAVGRATLGQLRNLGLPELIADTPEQFVRIAAELAGDLPRLGRLRATLRKRMQNSPLMDAPRFARNVEAAYRQMWRRWCAASPAPSEPSRRATDAPHASTGAGVRVPPRPAHDAALAQAQAYHRAGQLPEAEALCRQILQDEPNHRDALHLLAGLAHLSEDYAVAADCLRRLIGLLPNVPEFHNNLGLVCQALKRPDEERACYQRALELKPDYAEAHYNLGNLLRDQGQPAEAIAAYHRALALKPDYAEACVNLGNTWKDQGEIDQAIAWYQRGLERNPENASTYSNILLTLQYRAEVTPAELAQAHAEFERRYAAPLRAAWRPESNRRDPDRPLRLGLVSPDFVRHPVTRLLLGTLEHLAGQEIQAVGYHDRRVSDDMTSRVRAACTLWRPCARLSDEQLADQIRADQIDILVDLAGHTAKNRLLVFARKPAPLQVTWIGYEGSTGVRAIDYLLADRYVVPPELEPYCSEQVLRLPDAYATFDPPAEAPAVNRLPALESGVLTFGSFNNPAKITPRVVACWAEILRRVPQSRLILKYRGLEEAAAGARFHELFAQQGVAAQRLELRGYSLYPEYLASYHDLDVALDPFPFNGGATTGEALWMGVPVVTCPGATFASRHSFGYLSTIGLSDTIGRDLAEYVEIAVRLAADLPRLAELRAGLRSRMAQSPLCDGKRLAENLTDLLRRVWRQYALSASPGTDRSSVGRGSG